MIWSSEWTLMVPISSYSQAYTITYTSNLSFSMVCRTMPMFPPVQVCLFWRWTVKERGKMKGDSVAEKIIAPFIFSITNACFCPLHVVRSTVHKKYTFAHINLRYKLQSYFKLLLYSIVIYLCENNHNIKWKQTNL